MVWGGDQKLQTVTKIKAGEKYLAEETCEEYLPLKKEYILMLCVAYGAKYHSVSTEKQVHTTRQTAPKQLPATPGAVGGAFVLMF